MLCSKENKIVAVPKCEREVLSDVLVKKFNTIQVPTATFETFNGEQCAEVNGPYDLADIITGWKAVFSLSCIGNYGYLTKHIVHRINSICLRTKSPKLEKQIHNNISRHELRINGAIFTSKNSKADFVQCVFYSMTLQQMHKED